MAASLKESTITDDVGELTQSITGFTRDLYDQFSRQNPDTNLLFSPFSIATALGMTLAGAKGNTARQLTAALKMKPDDKSVHSVFDKLLGSLNSVDVQYTLTTANNMFVHKTFKMLDDFVKLTESSYKSGLTNVDFCDDTEGARYMINNWVENQTNHKIKDIIPPGMLTPDVVLVLVNALYFKGEWESPFFPWETKLRPFFLSNGENVQVDMMTETRTFLLGDLPELDCQVLELPYLGKQTSMFILLPNQIDGLADLEKSLTPDILMAAQTKVSPKMTDMSLPKFKIEFTLEMSGILQKLGIKDVFLQGIADLTGVADFKPGELFVSKVAHKTFVSVDEIGTEVTAATGVLEQLCCCFVSNLKFNANHPFLFYIQHKMTGTILFIGRLTKPETSVNA